MTKQKNYRKTLVACYLGFVTQAITANFAPLLFLTFKSTYGITLEKIAMIPLVFYLTQLLIDLAATKFADKIGYRTCVVTSQVLSAVGLVLMAILPEILPVPFIGILISVVLYAVGSGLIEVLVSPIVEACPFENKAGVMSLLHSFYCWGQVVVVLLTAIMIKLLGNDLWYIAPVIWALIPLINTINFLSVPIKPNLTKEEKTPFFKMLFSKQFILCIVIMICSGASEIGMSQWSSYFAEAGLKVTKMTGDLLGPCLFAVLMGTGRMIFGFVGEKINLKTALCSSAALCAVCYLGTCFIDNSVVSLLMCALTGISVSVMWPATLSLAARLFPKGGGAMYSVLALSGDTGCTLGPWFISFMSLKISQGVETGEALKTGLGFGAIFPILMILAVTLLSLKKMSIDKQSNNDIIKS